MNHRRGIFIGVGFGAILLLIGCERTASESASRSAAESSTATGKQSTAPSAGGTGGASPIENYKQARLIEAMRGLKYDTGVVELDPEYAPAIAGEVEGQSYDALITAAYELLNGGLGVEAIGAFTRTVIHSPDQVAGYEGLAEALITKGRVKESRAALRTALALDDLSVSLRFKYAQNLERMGDLPGQIAAYQRVLEVAPNHTEALSRLAIAHYFAEDFAGAWKYTHDCEAAGGAVPPQFRELLASRLSEPKP